MKKRELKHLNSPFIPCACGCGELIHSINTNGHQARFITHHNIQSFDIAPHWKGGRVINSGGYVLIYSPNHPFHDAQKYVREHRLVMEKHLKRYLEPSEVVHHINGDKKDNRIENLELLTSNIHGVLHYQNRRIDKLGRFIIK